MPSPTTCSTLVAKNSPMKFSPNPGSAAAIALQLSKRMQNLASRGEWDEVENIAAELEAAVMSVAEAERRPVLLAVQRSTAAVETEAHAARSNVGGKISELRRGQAAKKVYELS